MTTKALHITGPNASDWKLIDIPNQGLATLQSLVGNEGSHNWIERVPADGLPNGVNIWVDEEGKIKSLAPVAKWIYNGQVYDLLQGRVLVTGPKKSGITEAHIEKIKRHIQPLVG